MPGDSSYRFTHGVRRKSSPERKRSGQEIRFKKYRWADARSVVLDMASDRLACERVTPATLWCDSVKQVRRMVAPDPGLPYLQVRDLCFSFVSDSETPASKRQSAMAGAKYPLGVSFAPLMNPATNSLISNHLLDRFVGRKHRPPSHKHQIRIKYDAFE